MCGCIPIVPSSPLNQIYELLPVWIVEDWTDITDEKIIEKEKELLEKVKRKRFRINIRNWFTEIYSKYK